MLKNASGVATKKEGATREDSKMEQLRKGCSLCHPFNVGDSGGPKKKHMEALQRLMENGGYICGDDIAIKRLYAQRAIGATARLYIVPGEQKSKRQKEEGFPQFQLVLFLSAPAIIKNHSSSKSLLYRESSFNGAFSFCKINDTASQLSLPRVLLSK
eukprot:CAMPEP_0172300812 /NCGR_PEP_ID=MMETSP1058-20130122/2823_1 /TAXON_ID=83371 /ORGANISM="Detonula confervacea, Strain CCMP 353" /LENGTH=156 /DNA_ID=CAMNT_0013010713 /DNA_START=271 /DNA_END=742 /DNA_ORIENTATION=-